MGKRGPKSSAPGGVGYVTKKGYLRIRHEGRLRMAHDVAWELAYGPIPEGMQVHHKNEKKLDNRISNLELLDALTHKRIHSGCELRDGLWWKPCSVCEELKPVTKRHWYFTREGWVAYGRCRPCHIAKVVEAKRRRKRQGK
ncbi:hypothetical protein LCGC14_0274040 [marine sediment metagenome]|uniref:HNH endonuclease n=2 Tax=root TaxID=1 RepID=A0A9C9NE92_9HYPH|nr:HNH endonuclease [Aurantimonas coralicida]